MASSAARVSATNKSEKTGDDIFTTDLGKNDYDWLLTPPGTPLVNAPDHSSSAYGDDFLSHAVLPNLVRSLAAIKTSRLSSSKSEPIMKEPSFGALQSLRSDPALRSGRNGFHRSTGNVSSSSSFMTNNSLNAANKRATVAPGSRPSSRPTTPTKRSTIPSTPASRPTTPTSRAKAAPTPLSRPTTPTNRSRGTTAPPVLSRPSTPSSRPTIPLTSRNIDSNLVTSCMTARGSVPSRPTTPLRRPIAPETQTQSLSATVTRSSSVSKGRPVPSRSTPSSRGSSPTIKPNAWQQLTDIPGFSLEPPPNLRTSLPVRSTSNSRGASLGFARPGASSTGTTVQAMTSSDTHSERLSDASTRRSCSPSMSRGRSGTLPGTIGDRQGFASTVMVRNGGKLDKSPSEGGVRSTNAVEKMIQMRRPFPSSRSPEAALSLSQIKHAVKPATPIASKDCAGYGRVMPRKSVDLPMRELRQSTSNGLRSLVRNVPTSSIYSVRPAGMRVVANSSPVATSSNASSDYSMSIARNREGSEPGEEFTSEVGSKACPASPLSSLVKDTHTYNWLGSPDEKDGTLEPNQIVQQSVDKPTSCESPLLCRHGCVEASCDLCNMKIRLQKLTEKCRASLSASLQCSQEVHKGSLGNGGVLASDQL